jgi:vacuolar protein sorting-associated protein 45
MDIVAAISNYVTKMVSSDGSAGPSGKMKILLLDSETVRSYPRKAGVTTIAHNCYTQVSIISTAITQSTLLSHEVYLIEYVCAQGEDTGGLFACWGWSDSIVA